MLEYNMLIDDLPTCCSFQLGEDRQTAVHPAAESHSVPRKALWQGKPLPPASLHHRSSPVSRYQARGQAEGPHQGQVKCLLTVWWCCSRTSLIVWDLKQVVAMVSAGKIGSGGGRMGRRHAAERSHHHAKPKYPPVGLLTVRNRDQEAERDGSKVSH